MNDISRTRLAEAAFVVLTLIWGSTFPLVKFFGAEMDPVVAMFYRFIVALLLVFPVLLFRGIRLVSDLRSGLVLGLVLWFVFILQMAGIRYTTASNSAFITSLFVVTTPLFNYLLRGLKPTRIQGAGAALSLAGLWLLTGGVDRINVGDVLTFGSAVACGVYITLLEDIAHRTKSLLALNFHQFLVCTLLTGAFLVVDRSSFAVPRTLGWIAILYLALFASILTGVVQTWGQKYIPPVRAALIFMLEPVVGAIIAWGWLGEKLDYLQLFGAGLILVGAAVAVLRPVRIVTDFGTGANGVSGIEVG